MDVFIEKKKLHKLVEYLPELITVQADSFRSTGVGTIKLKVVRSEEGRILDITTHGVVTDDTKFDYRCNVIDGVDSCIESANSGFPSIITRGGYGLRVFSDTYYTKAIENYVDPVDSNDVYDYIYRRKYYRYFTSHFILYGSRDHSMLKELAEKQL